ncbi:hypothetical protein [Thermoleptolyngbya sp. M55_K2018_002]|uniref:hypothetical protein n=1 Tax=Thermoleptolyngbya sp. M55_K2018_002 TaxID=2747808 RepID=UPI0019F0C276|nr:hypothetical protein [Thermoleptolyngbya sp. M55_K2018_002]HIK39603.1 DUF2281 domain-containing protein [Thermoleptolyngbya sp. M55_K2018_002]
MTKEEMIQELESYPESVLSKLLELARSFQSADDTLDEEAWQAYLASEIEREEVYRRLANS